MANTGHPISNRKGGDMTSHLALIHRSAANETRNRTRTGSRGVALLFPRIRTRRWRSTARNILDRVGRSVTVTLPWGLSRPYRIY